MHAKYDGEKVYLGDDSHLNIVGHSRVLIRFPDGRVKGINGVMHILGLEHNLLLVSTLNDGCIKVVFSNGGCNMV